MALDSHVEAPAINGLLPFPVSGQEYYINNRHDILGCEISMWYDYCTYVFMTFVDCPHGDFQRANSVLLNITKHI